MGDVKAVMEAEIETSAQRQGSIPGCESAASASAAWPASVLRNEGLWNASLGGRCEPVQGEQPAIFEAGASISCASGGLEMSRPQGPCGLRLESSGISCVANSSEGLD